MTSAPSSLRPVLLALVLLVALPGHALAKASLLHTPPERIQSGEAFVIDGLFTGTQRITRLFLRYRCSGQPYTEMEMELQYGDLFRASLPSEQIVPPVIEYYVEGVTPGGDRVPLFKSATRPARVTIDGPSPPRPSLPRSTPEPAPSHTASAHPAPEPDDAMAALSAELPSDDVPPPSPSTERTSRAAPSPELQSARSELEEDLALYSAEDTLALATRHEEKVKKVPAIASSFGREQIRALGARTVADVLDVVPGLTISRDVQGFHRVSIRGLRNDAEVLFLLNGQRLNSFYDGKALMNLPVENLERIEVIRGPGSSLYGAGAFLGVVNLVTHRADGILASVSGGGYPELDDRLATTFDGHITAAQTFGRFRVHGDVDVWQQAGDSSLVEKDALDAETLAQKLRDPLQPAGRTRDERFLLNVGGGFGLELPQGRLSASLRLLSESRSALIGLFDTVGPDSNLGWLVLLGDVSYEHDVSDTLRLRARLHGDQQDTDRLFQLAPHGFRTGSGEDRLFPEGLLEQSRVTVRSLGASLDAELSLAASNRLSLGAVAELQALGAYSYETNYTLDNRRRPTLTAPEGLVDPLTLAEGAATRRLTLGLFAQDQWTVMEALTLTFGVRLDVTQLPSVDPDTGTLQGTELFPSLTPRVGLVFSPTDALVLKLLYGRAFRSPTLQELVEVIPDTYYNQGRFEGNPGLRPAVVDTLEAGADLIQSAGEARVRLRANAFFERFSNPIIPVDTTGNIVPLRNRELGVHVYGVEGEARLEASKRATAWVNASLFRAEDLELPQRHRYLTDTPQARFNAGLSMPIGDFINFDVVVRAGAERRNNSRSVLELIRRYKIPAYSLITAQVRTEPIAGHFELAVVAHNVFDHDMRDDVPRPDRISGLLPREGVSAFLTLRARY